MNYCHELLMSLRIAVQCLCVSLGWRICKDITYQELQSQDILHTMDRPWNQCRLMQCPPFDLVHLLPQIWSDYIYITINKGYMVMEQSIFGSTALARDRNWFCWNIELWVCREIIIMSYLSILGIKNSYNGLNL